MKVRKEAIGTSTSSCLFTYVLGKVLFQTTDGSVVGADGRLLFVSGQRFQRDIVEGQCCFLCGASPDKAEFTDEHVIPDWVLREFSLHSKQVTLANGATIPYSRYRVPCCSSCNALLGETVEKPISDMIKGGYQSVSAFIKKNGAWRLFAWMNLIFLKTHLKDRAFRFSLDAREGTEKISELYDWSPMHHIHCIVRAYYTKATLDPRLMGSVFVLPAKVRPHLGLFDYADFSVHKTMLIRLGETAIICVLDDACATISLIQNWLFPKLGGPLSPVQLREVLSRIAHANSAISSRPQFHTVFDEGLPHLSVTHADHFEAEKGDPEKLGALMHHTCGPLLEDYGGQNKDAVIEGLRSGRWTFLVDPSGKFDDRSMEPMEIPPERRSN